MKKASCIITLIGGPGKAKTLPAESWQQIINLQIAVWSPQLPQGENHLKVGTTGTLKIKKQLEVVG